MRFEDPIVRCTDRSQYLLNMRALRMAFDISFTIHEVNVNPLAEIVVRCAQVCPVPRGATGSAHDEPVTRI